MNARLLILPALAVLLWLPVSCTGPAGSTGDSAAAGAGLARPPPTAAVNYTVPAAAGPDQLARLAVRHHPSIQAARHRAGRLASKVPQELALPDPMLELGAGTMEEMGSTQVDGMLGVKQTIPFPGKRAEAAGAADREAAAAEAEVRSLELKLTEQIHAAWWDLHLAERTIALTRDNRAVLEAVRDAVDARVAADQASQADQLRLANEIALIDKDLAEAGQVGRSARAQLNSLLNRPAGAALPSAGAASIPATGSLDSLLARAQSAHPEVAAAEQRAEAFRHRLKRAELENYPDFTVGVGGSTATSSGRSAMMPGGDEIFATIGINIPLWREPRRAMIREAREGIAETEAMLAATRSDLRYRVEDAWFRARTAGEVAALFETRLIPDARQAFDVTLTGYSAGTSNFTDLLETWRQLLAYQLQHARNRAQLGKATATLRAAAGVQ